VAAIGVTAPGAVSAQPEFIDRVSVKGVSSSSWSTMDLVIPRTFLHSAPAGETNDFAPDNCDRTAKDTRPATPIL
jgi:hypothetical protein